MPAALSLIVKILGSPIWLLWRSYLVLWWAFTPVLARQTPATPGSSP